VSRTLNIGYDIFATKVGQQLVIVLVGVLSDANKKIRLNSWSVPGTGDWGLGIRNLFPQMPLVIPSVMGAF
jgi:hypothetical protein